MNIRGRSAGGSGGNGPAGAGWWRGRWKTLIWLGVAGLVLGLLVWRTPRERFAAALGDLDWRWAVGALLVHMFAQSVLAVRWVLLLRVQGVRLRLGQAVQLTFLGLFYNNVMPGAVGGDILKAWFVTHHGAPHLKVEAAVTVVVDRMLGLCGMMLVAAGASVFIGPEVAYGGWQVRWLVWAIVGGLAVAGAVLLSRRVRRGLLVSRAAERLPFAGVLKKIDAAVQVYRHHPGTVAGAVGITVGVQSMSIVAVWMLSQGLGLAEVELLECVLVMPIIWLIAAAVPVPGGLGVLEGAVMYLFAVVISPEDPRSAMGVAAALALLNRLMIAAASVPGGLVPVFGGHLPRPAEMEEFRV